MKKRNGVISLWKFIFAIVIIFFHTSELYNGAKNPLFPSGYIAVEFFFLVSGFYFAKSVLSDNSKIKCIGEETCKFIAKKVCALMPYVFVGYIMHLITQGYYTHWGIYNVVNSIWNLLLLRGLGLGNVIMMGQLWYISAMLVSMFILYPLLRKYKTNFILIFSPLIVILGLSYTFYTFKSVNTVNGWAIFFSANLLRGFIDINLGILIYYIHSLLKKYEYKKVFKVFLTFISEFLLILILIITTFIKNGKRYDFVMLLIISIALLIIFSEKTYDYKFLLNNNFVNYLGKISLPMYINHTFFIVFFEFSKYFENVLPIYKSLLVVFCCILFSIVEEYFIRNIDFKKIRNSIKRIIIKE